eukprot:GHRQ01028939.1.p1 GENE.GHRQ01028939.1~~GHRQ01028939.1.p1  ORF type:complete len:114 (-),score=17.85 GHRQ01028939.1:522-863(-)
MLSLFLAVRLRHAVTDAPELLGICAQLCLLVDLQVKTSDVRGAGTDANVTVTFIGSAGSSGPHKLVRELLQAPSCCRCSTLRDPTGSVVHCSTVQDGYCLLACLLLLRRHQHV